MKWFIEGDRNTKFFHNIVKGRRRRLELTKIQKADGTWAEGSEVGEEAVKFYQDQFSSDIQESNSIKINPLFD